MSHIEFGQCLKVLLGSLSISINRMAKAINVDASLANRWVNGKRVPTYNSTYIEDIVEFLAQNVKNSWQVESIDNLFLKVHGTRDNSLSIKDKLRKILYEAQGYSLEKLKNKTSKNSSQGNKKDRTLDLPNSYRLSAKDIIIFGTNDIIAACNSALYSALNYLPSSKGKIYITYFNELPISQKEYDNVLRFHKALLELLKNGWEVHFLVRINENIDRTIGLIDFTKSLISTGRFSIYYLSHYEHSTIGKDYVIVSDYCAMACFTFNDKNAGSLFLTPAAITLYTEYVKNLISTYGRSLLHYYSMDECIDYNLSLANCEDSIGNRILYKDCFGVITLPLNLYEDLLKRRNLNPSEIKKALTFYKKRLEAFHSNIDAYEHIDLYPINFINHLVKNQEINLYDHTGITPVQLEKREIIQLLENIIHLS